MWAWFAAWWLSNAGKRQDPVDPAPIPESGSWWSLVGMFWPFIVAFAIIIFLL